MTSSRCSFAYYKNLNISIMKEDISKRKTPFIFISKSLKNKQYLFLLHMHFKRNVVSNDHGCCSCVVINSILFHEKLDTSFLLHCNTNKHVYGL